MNRLSRDLGNNKVLSIRPKPSHEVVTMPVRLNRSESRCTVLQMRARSPHYEHGARTVLTMPSRSKRTQQHSPVIEMFSPVEDASENSESHVAIHATDRRGLIGARLSLSDGLRMTLVALFALLGWLQPTHGKDPGAAAAKPFKLELLDVISGLRIPAASSAALAARGAAPELPSATREEISAGLASAA